MELKVHLHGAHGKVVGLIDAPKIKKRDCRTHFGLLALLNHPKLSQDWFTHCKDVVTVRDAVLQDHSANVLAERERVQLNPRHILWAFEEDIKERRRMKREQVKAPEPVCQSDHRLRFESDCGYIFEGDYVSEVNEIGVMRGKGFISLANATVIYHGDPASFRHLPFVAINSHLVTNITAATEFVKESVRVAASSAA